MKPREFFKHLLPPPPPEQAAPERGGARYFRRRLDPRHLDRTVSGSTLDADLLHSVVTQAREGQMTPLLSLYRQIEVADDVIQGAMNSRKLAVLANPLRVEPFSAASVDVAAASRFSSCLDASPSFFDGVKHLLCSAVWPVSVSELRWLPGDLEYASFEMRNVPLEQLDYRSGDLRIARVDAGGHVGSESDYPDPARYIVHRGHLLTHPDTFGGPFRALIFWHLFGACNRDWWARFLERFGAPFLVGKYEADDEESRRVLEQAFSEAARTFGLVATSDTNIELHEAKSSVGSDAFDRFHDISTAAKTRLILGQTLSAKTDATGLGSGVANLQGRVREDYAAYDRLALADTLRRSLITPFMRINRLPGSPPRFV